MKPIQPRLLALLLGLACAQAGAQQPAQDDSGKACDPSRPQVCKLCVKPETQEPTVCEGDERGKMIDDSATVEHGVAPNTEREAAEFDKLESSRLTVAERRQMLEGMAPMTPPQATTRIEDMSAAANFDSRKALLLPPARKALDILVERLKGKQNIRLEIVGHTDNQRVGQPVTVRRFGNNQKLSEARALAVAEYLKERLSLQANAFAVSGKGETQPVADNTTVAGMARNRRVEIRVWYDEAAAPPPPQTERVVETDKCLPAPGVSGGQPFSISIDGQPLETDTKQIEADRQLCVDVALEKGEIQVKFDPLNVSPALNVWTTPSGVLRGKPIEFHTYSNYAYWIKKAEIRIFGRGQQPQEKPGAIVAVEIGGAAQWQPPPETPEEVFFLLRVYDEKGRFDETALKPLRLLERSRPLADLEALEREKLTGYGESSLQLRNIPVSGGTITVSGEKFKPEQTVRALGAVVPVGANGRFATRQIMPAGPRTVEVNVSGADGQGTTFKRNVSIADRDWFYIALADITIGRDRSSGPAQLVTGDKDHYENETYIDGRGAFYLKGKIKGEYLLTAAADTREQPLNDLFSNFWSKDPRYLLRRIDPDRYYPVYGDDSTIVDDAPTQGKFYVRLERDDSHVMWGNFQTAWTGTELTQYSRGLYGANLLLNLFGTTSYGEKRTALNAFAAEPGTVQSREEFRGTGGSLYFLRRLDITQGSERVWVEIRDKDSGFVLERKPLTPAQDYDINYLQGRVLLRVPLPSVADGSSLVQTSSLNGHPLYLVVTYEYVPGLEALDSLALGFRGSHWFGDYLRLGLTSYRQGDDGADQRLKGIDILLRYKPGTYLRAEGGRSQGAGVGNLSSIDGGFGFQQQTAGGRRADAKRVEAAVDLGDLWEGGRGRIGGYWQDRDQDYSAPGQLSPGEAVTQRGALASVPIGDSSAIDLKYDSRSATSQTVNSGEVALKHKLSSQWGVSVGARQDDRDTGIINASPVLSEEGKRTDVILRIDYKPLASEEQAKAADAEAKAAADAASGPAQQQAAAAGFAPQRGSLFPTAQPAYAGVQPAFDPSIAAGVAGSRTPGLRYAPWDLYGFVQGTVARSGERRDNDRVGLGGTYQINDRFRLGAEASAGDGGWGGRLSGDYRVDDRSNYYLQYTMETERPDLAYRGRQGTLVSGSHYRFSEEVGVFGETRWTNGAGPQGLTQAFGIDLAPHDRWTTGLKVEFGRISDPLAGDLKRRALGLAAGYKFEHTKFAANVEYRDESGTGGDRQTWLLRSALGHQYDPAWRLLAKLNFAFSEASQGAFFDGDFVEAVLGAAYRPIDNDRWNTLFKYTYFYNLPSPGQVTNTANTVLDYTQRSHVLNFDTIYDAKPWLSLGFKYGFRWSDLRASKTEGPWFDSRADLMVLRADWHWVYRWDIVTEARRLRVYEADDSRAGFLLAVYRYLGEHVKLGVGYNFTDFSDNLTDLSFRSRGWFINAISTF